MYCSHHSFDTKHLWEDPQTYLLRYLVLIIHAVNYEQLSHKLGHLRFVMEVELWSILFLSHLHQNQTISYRDFKKIDEVALWMQKVCEKGKCQFSILTMTNVLYKTRYFVWHVLMKYMMHKYASWYLAILRYAHCFSAHACTFLLISMQMIGQMQIYFALIFLFNHFALFFIGFVWLFCFILPPKCFYIKWFHRNKSTCQMEKGNHGLNWK